MNEHETATYKAVTDGRGYRFIFYCQLSGAHACTTEKVYIGEPEEAVLTAWKEEGCKHFNRCGRCGKRVIDAVFNAEVLSCVDCAPYEAEPNFCRHCGAKVETPATRCQHCGKPLIYEGGEEHYDTEASV